MIKEEMGTVPVHHRAVRPFLIMIIILAVPAQSWLKRWPESPWGRSLHRLPTVPIALFAALRFPASGTRVQAKSPLLVSCRWYVHLLRRRSLRPVPARR